MKKKQEKIFFANSKTTISMALPKTEKRETTFCRWDYRMKYEDKRRKQDNQKREIKTNLSH